MYGHSDRTEQNWRLEVQLHVEDMRPALHRLMRHLHPDFSGEAGELRVSIPHGMVVTHDGSRLVAYGTGKADAYVARNAMQRILEHHGMSGSLQISQWDEEHRRWWHVDPPPDEYEKHVRDTARWITQQTAVRDGTTVETRTLVANAGKFIRVQFEETMLAVAQKLGIKCEMLEHPHLLTTQVAFMVTGPSRKIDAFWARLVDECGETIRKQRQTMINPLAPIYTGKPV